MDPGPLYIGLVVEYGTDDNPGTGSWHVVTVSEDETDAALAIEEHFGTGQAREALVTKWNLAKGIHETWLLRQDAGTVRVLAIVLETYNADVANLISQRVRDFIAMRVLDAQSQTPTTERTTP